MSSTGQNRLPQAREARASTASARVRLPGLEGAMRMTRASLSACDDGYGHRGGVRP